MVLRILLVLFLLFGMLTGAGFGGAVAGASWYIQNEMPPVSGPGAIHGLNVQTTKIYDRNGNRLYDIVDEQTGLRREVKLNEVSPLVISATLAAEDASFYDNPGVDPVGILRAFMINYEGKGQSGASTITQQLVRQVNLPEEERTQRT